MCALPNARFALCSTPLGLPGYGMQLPSPAFSLKLHEPCLSMIGSVRVKMQAIGLPINDSELYSDYSFNSQVLQELIQISPGTAPPHTSPMQHCITCITWPQAVVCCRAKTTRSEALLLQLPLFGTSIGVRRCMLWLCQELPGAHTGCRNAQGLLLNLSPCCHRSLCTTLPPLFPSDLALHPYPRTGTGVCVISVRQHFLAQAVLPQSPT